MFGYNRAPGTSLGSLVVTTFALLVVGVPFYLIVLSHGWAGILAMPYAIPVAAVALALIVAFGHRLTGTGASYAWLSPRTSNPAGGIVVSLLFVVGSIVMSFKAGADVRRYNADPTCSSVFAAAGGAGACALEDVRISQAYSCGRNNGTSCLTLESPSRPATTVRLRANFRGNVFRGALDGDRTATVQYFDGRAVQIETHSGRVATADYPLENEKFWTLLGLVFGGFGIIGAIAALVRGVL
jgi:hypothetical protein